MVDGDCTTFCQAPTCNGGKANGSPCGSGVDCQSKFCSPQGVCCDAACTGTCVSCNQAGSNGTCKPISAGQPPFVASQCADQGAGTCGTDGTCNGSGACRFYAGGTQCVPPMCTVPTGTFTPERTCSAGHACQMVTTTTCGNFSCNASGCLGSCATDNDCVAPSKCFGARCGGLKGSYFKTQNWSGTATIRVDGKVDFPNADTSLGFDHTSPFPNDPTWEPAFADHFSVRWTGKLTTKMTGQYTLRTLSDDGISVYINGAVVPGLDHASLVGGGQTFTATSPITLTAGQPVTIRVDYAENISYAQAHLYWSGPDSGNVSVIIPTSRLTPDP
jgi:hypothetical protein